LVLSRGAQRRLATVEAPVVPPDEGCCVLGRFSDLIIKL